MIPAWARLVMASVLGAVAAGLVWAGQGILAGLTGTFAAFMLAAWFRYHDVLRAGRAYDLRNADAAWELLEGVPFGGRFLRRECRIYYHHVRARCLLRREDWGRAADEAERALAIPGIGDEAPGCHLAAAQACAHLGRLDDARRHADEARRLPHSEVVERGLARIGPLLNPTT
jgi:hypothetical protein